MKNQEMLEMALVGLQVRRAELDAAIAEVNAEIRGEGKVAAAKSAPTVKTKRRGRPPKSAAATTATATVPSVGVPAKKGKRKMSAAGREAIRAGQVKRREKKQTTTATESAPGPVGRVGFVAEDSEPETE